MIPTRTIFLYSNVGTHGTSSRGIDSFKFKQKKTPFLLFFFLNARVGIRGGGRAGAGCLYLCMLLTLAFISFKQVTNIWVLILYPKL